jgi:hypothetical protein
MADHVLALNTWRVSITLLTHPLSTPSLPPSCTSRRPKQPTPSVRTGVPVSSSPLKLTNRRGTIATPLHGTASSLSEPLASLSQGLSQLLHNTAAQLGTRVDLKRLDKLHRTLAYEVLEVFMTQTESAAEDIQGRLPPVWTTEVVFARQLDSLRVQCAYSRAAFDQAYVKLRAMGVIVVRPAPGGRQMRICLGASSL